VHFDRTRRTRTRAHGVARIALDGSDTRAIWTGEIAFGLVAIPVRLYAATKDLSPHFHLVHEVCGTRVQNVRWCPHCNKAVPWQDIVKGYEVSKGRYAKLEKKELAEAEAESAASGIDIAEFVEPAQVDLAFIEKSYWVGPAGKSARSYELLHDALEKTHKVAIARVKIRTRTRVGMLRPRQRRFSLDLMRFGDELVDASAIELPQGKSVKAASTKELHLALGLIDQLTVKSFDPSKHPDEYRSAVAALVEKKVRAGEELAGDERDERDERATTRGAANEQRGGKVIDLAEILQRSLRRAKSPVGKCSEATHGATHAKKSARPRKAS
jgi:DNA end-binding protein Ku